MLRQSRRIRIAVTLVALVVSLVAVEAVLRQMGGLFQDSLLTSDQERGWRVRAGFGGWMGGSDAPFWVTTNQEGMRDIERTRAKPANTTRIAVLGDSYVQGISVPFEHTLTTGLESRLRGCAGSPARGIEVLNFGVSGYGTAQELLTWRHQARDFQPDIAVLAFYTNNDVFNNVRSLNPVLFPEQSPYFTLNGDALVLDTTFRRFIDQPQPWWRRARIALTDRFRIAQLLHGYYAQARERFIPPPEGDHRPHDEIDLETAIYREPSTPEIAEAWRVTEALLLQWAREVRASDAEPWIVTLANAAQVQPSIADREALMRSLGVDSLFYPDRRVLSFAAAHDIAALGLAEPMAARAAATHTFMNGGSAGDPPGEGHWNQTGNAVAAELMANALCARSAVMTATRAGAR